MGETARFREKKEMYYGKKIAGLSAFLNIWMPLMSAVCVYGLIVSITSFSGVSDVVRAFICTALAVVCTIFVRGADSTGFWASCAFLVFFAGQTLWGILQTFVAAGVIGSATGQAVTAGTQANTVGGIAGAYILSGVQLGVGLVLVSNVIASCVVLIFPAFYLIVFIRNRSFFLSSLKDLRARFDAANSQRPA